MRRLLLLLMAVVAVAPVIAFVALSPGQTNGAGAPIFRVTIPAGYRDRKLISVAHEEGSLNDLRAILGNDIAIDAYREGKRPFPDRAIIARLAFRRGRGMTRAARR